MAASNVEVTDRAMQSTFKLPEGFQSKVVEPGNPKMVKREVKNVKLTPSAFMKEMSLDTKQKLANTQEMYLPPIIELLDMTETTLQKFSMLDTDRPIFQPFPSEITFQNYEPCETYEVPLILRNHDQVPRMVKVIQEDSPYFRIICPSDVGRKVAPGMTTTFKLIFVPEESKDYIHELICVTEREKFLVPVKAIGARAILDFPDFINFSVCPVKYNTQKTLLVRNIGKRETKFTLQAKKPFFVEPIHGYLEVGESFQVTVEFIPERIGDHSEDLILHLDTGEDIFVNLYGAATDVNVRLDKNSVMIEKTYISLANQRVVSICNRSDVIVHFWWKAFATPEEEEQQKIRFVSDLMTEEEEETKQFLKECTEDPTLHEQMPILIRTFQNRRQLVQDDRMLLSDDVFIIEPVEGDIWPNSTAEINIICRPKAEKVYHQTVYCDITGRETRLPLRIKCEGLGPKVILNVDQVEIGNVFVSSKQIYEIVMANKGEIPAVYTRIAARTPLGSCFCFNPSEGTLLPGGYQMLEVTFKASILGDFIADLFFSVQGSCEPVQVTFKGCVIGPTFHFNVPVLNFGEVSFGFPKTLSCCLINTSLVPMTVKLRIPGDGIGEISRTSFSQASERKSISSWGNIESGGTLKEFTINPSLDIIKSHVGKEIQVSFCSNTAKKYELALIVEVENVGLEVLAIPIVARCIVPTLEVVNPHIDLGRCFLKHPYQCMIKLQNSNDLPACYGLVPQEVDDQLGILYSSPEPYGIIDSCSTVEIPLMVEAQYLGELNTDIYIALFGKSQFPLAEEFIAQHEIKYFNVLVATCTFFAWFQHFFYQSRCVGTNDKIIFTVHLKKRGFPLFSTTTPTPCIPQHLPAPWLRDFDSQGYVYSQQWLQMAWRQDFLLMLSASLASSQSLAERQLALAGMRSLLTHQVVNLAVHISCIGEGPVVHLSSTKIDWGKIQVLTDVPKTICLSNESLIPARVMAKMVKKAAFYLWCSDCLASLISSEVHAIVRLGKEGVRHLLYALEWNLRVAAEVPSGALEGATRVEVKSCDDIESRWQWMSSQSLWPCRGVRGAMSDTRCPYDSQCYPSAFRDLTAKCPYVISDVPELYGSMATPMTMTFVFLMLKVKPNSLQLAVCSTIWHCNAGRDQAEGEMEELHLSPDEDIEGDGNDEVLAGEDPNDEAVALARQGWRTREALIAARLMRTGPVLGPQNLHCRTMHVQPAPGLHMCKSSKAHSELKFLTSNTLENSKWHLEPSEIAIPPLGHTDLSVVAHLDDTIWSEDKVHLVVENSHTRSIHVQATGIGTTIVPNKPFGPVLNLGAIFRCSSKFKNQTTNSQEIFIRTISNVCRYSVKLTNRGRRRHQIYWKTIGFPLTFKPNPQKHSVSRDMKYRDSSVMGHYISTFKVRPLRMDLKPGMSDILTLEGESDGPREVKKRKQVIYPQGFRRSSRQTAKTLGGLSNTDQCYQSTLFDLGAVLENAIFEIAMLPQLVDALEMSNVLQYLCWECHQQVTVTDRPHPY
ncbi:hydrocephalus-inducing protein-like [Carcharodon carcharias]|uniref:hydrocephalus-inducing protein-like n=1 Tax=Carcharodon carcharias TaxID=13397 RepID=UPI001B7DEAB0|nr:hydrocephalus-inducing protein-like [Carcharodon carcharias]